MWSWLDNDDVRFWFPVVALCAFGVFASQKLIRTHVETEVRSPNYNITREIPGIRGSILDAKGKRMAKSIPFWEYRLDPVAMTNRTVKLKNKKERPRKPEAIVRTIANALKLDYAKVLAKSRDSSNRYQFLAVSSDNRAHSIMTNSSAVAGVSITVRQPRQTPGGRRLCHVIGSVNAENVGSCGIELKYNKELSGFAGSETYMRDARGNVLYEKLVDATAPMAGCDVHLTVDDNMQYEAEDALAWGIKEFGAGSGWCVVLDAKTGAVLALASQPDFDPRNFGHASEDAKVNRVTGFTYEPGSVMKVITACAAIDTGFASPDSLYNTDRGDPRYYRLPGDAGHVWEPMMTLRDAIVHSSNIVIGKLGFDLGQKTLLKYFKAFGFGAKTGIELPGEEYGILPSPMRGSQDWDLATRSRAPIGQAISVTAMQLASAYQAIANDGIRMKPFIVSRVVEANGTERSRTEPKEIGRPISRATSRTVREMMLGVASREGTARRAAIPGYSVAGKTGTAQKSAGKKGYLPGLYRASFCGIVPSGVVKRDSEDLEPVPPRVVVLVTLDFDERTKYHQGGNSAAPVFKRIATAAMRYLAVTPDRPEDLMATKDSDEFNRIMDDRVIDAEAE